ncbi:MAG: transcriptional repressor [Deltaproteobacteria bacterium]|nr:transcriptional repressor [Deltaproteobacteria bacterium]
MCKTNTRLTKQRKLILEELERVKDHPTAYEVYERVRGRLPQISLGTVYRNLDILSANGIIKRLDIGQGQRRFDITTDDHKHIRCIFCNRIDDIPLNTYHQLTTIIGIVGDVTGYRGIGCSMDFHGICPECQKQGNRIHSSPEQKPDSGYMNNAKNKEE